MALHIDLYHEVKKQQHARRRDPLKLGIIGLICVVAGFLAYYGLRLSQAHDVNARVSSLEAEWQKFEPKQKVAKAREDELIARTQLADGLMKRIESRLFWAPILQQVLQCVPNEVQLTKLEGGNSKERVGQSSLSVTGLASSHFPRKVAENLRTALDEKLGENFKKVEAHFIALEDAEAKATLDGSVGPTASFTIQFQLNNLPEAAPAPAATRRKVAVQ